MDTESMSESAQNTVLVFEFLGLLSVVNKEEYLTFDTSHCSSDVSNCPVSFTFGLPIHIRYHAMSNCNITGEPYSQVFIPPPLLLIGRVPDQHESTPSVHAIRQVSHYYDLNGHKYPDRGA
jgi:hypothetical protein